MTSFEPTRRTCIHRCAEKASYDKADIHAAIDSIPHCTVALCDPETGLPRQMVTTHWRVGDALYLHGGIGSAFYKLLVAGCPVAVSIAATDGLVLARSAFETSINYRSVMIYGRFEAVQDPDEQLVLLEAFYEHLLPGRWQEIRRPSAKEMRATYVLRLPLTEVVAKLSVGMPDDKDEDLVTPQWGGVRHYQHGWAGFDADAASDGLPPPPSVQAATGRG